MVFLPLPSAWLDLPRDSAHKSSKSDADDLGGAAAGGAAAGVMGWEAVAIGVDVGTRTLGALGLSKKANMSFLDVDAG